MSITDEQHIKTQIQEAVKAERERIAGLLICSCPPNGECDGIMKCFKCWMQYLEPTEEPGRSPGSAEGVGE